MADKHGSEQMEYLGEHFGLQLYRNSEGFIEAYKSIGLVNMEAYCRPAKSLQRIVSNVTTVEDFAKFLAARKEHEWATKKIRGKYEPYKDTNQTKLDVL